MPRSRHACPTPAAVLVSLRGPLRDRRSRLFRPLPLWQVLIAVHHPRHRRSRSLSVISRPICYPIDHRDRVSLSSHSSFPGIMTLPERADPSPNCRVIPAVVGNFGQARDSGKGSVPSR
jgi:hypothetical protein